MSTIADRTNASPLVAELPMRSDDAQQVGPMSPVLATPAAFAAGLAAAAGVAAAVTAGVAIGAAID